MVGGVRMGIKTIGGRDGVRMGIKTIGVRDQIIRTLLAILMTMVCTLSSVGGF